MPARTASFNYGSRCQLPESATNAAAALGSYDKAAGAPVSYSGKHSIDELKNLFTVNVDGSLDVAIPIGQSQINKTAASVTHVFAPYAVAQVPHA